MPWGEKVGVGDWTTKLRSNDETLRSLLVMRNRKMTSNDWSSLCESLVGNTKLEELKASGHALETEAVEAFAAMLPQNSGLKRLALGDSEFGDERVKLLSEGLKGNGGLEELELDLKSITAEGARAIAAALSANTSLRKLKLARNALTDAGVAFLAEVLETSNSTLLDLDIAETGLGDAGAISLAAALASPTCGLHRLSLADNTLLGSEGAAALWAAIAKRNASSSSSSPASGLRALILDGCEEACSEEACQAMLASSQSPNWSLTELSMAGVLVAPGDVSAVARAIGGSSSLSKLGLAKTKLDDAFVAALVAALDARQQSTQEGGAESALKRVDLTSCALTAAGLGQLLTCPALKLESLCLFDNSLKEGVPDLLQLLAAASSPRTAASLTDLDLGANGISKEGAMELFKSLQQTPSMLPALKTLGMGANDGVADVEDDEEMGLLVEALRTRAVPLDVVIKAGVRSDPTGQPSITPVNATSEELPPPPGQPGPE